MSDISPSASSVPTPATSASPTPSIKEEVKSYIFQAKVSQRVPEIVGGKGVRIQVKDPYTGEISELLDGVTGAAVGALGWGDEEIVDYITEAAKNTTYQFSAVVGSDYSEKLAKFYIDNSPAGAFAAALWTTSGSEANEMTLKTIRQYWVERGQPKKLKTLSRYNSYHGYSIGCLSLGDTNRSHPFKDILFPESQFVKLPEYLPYHYSKDGESLEDYSVRLLKEYEDIILREDPDTIASMSIEPVSGTSLGTPVPTKTYLYGLRKLCDKYDIVFHLDEVMCGTGRLNPNGGLNAWENFLPLNEGPDIQTVGKTLGSGYVTIAGMLVSPKIRSAFINGTNSIIGGQTYAGHGFNCAVALKIQEKVIKQGLTKNIFEVGNYFGSQLTERLLNNDEIKIVGDVRGLGGFWSVEFIKDRKTKEIFERSLFVGPTIHKLAFAKGLSCMGGNDNLRGKGGDFVMFSPSFVITKKDADDMVSILLAAVKEMQAKLVADKVI